MTIFDDICGEVEYDQYSNYIAIWCPFDEHKTKALFVYEDLDKPENERMYYCVSCNKGGKHEYLWKVLTGKNVRTSPSVVKAQKFLPNWKRWEEMYGTIEALVSRAHNNVVIYPRLCAWYLEKRKLMDVYEQCMLGYIDEWMFFPILDQNGKVVDVIVRDSKGRSKYVIHSNDNETPLLYVPNWKRVMQSKLVYIVYGLIDALALEMCGLPVITGSTGKSLSEKRLIQLNKKYAIIPDKDEDGAARKLAMSLGNFTRIIRLPYNELEDCKDPDDIRMKYGLEYLKNLINV